MIATWEGNQMKSFTSPETAYLIRIGNFEFRVHAHGEAEAIAMARRCLAREWPRLYDVIRNLETSRFQIAKAA